MNKAQGSQSRHQIMQKKRLTKDVNITYKKQTAARKIRTGTAELPRIRNSTDNLQKGTRIRAAREEKNSRIKLSSKDISSQDKVKKNSDVLL